MSATAQPISPRRFADALSDLPISSLHAKVAELRNSIAHLDSSNKELEEFVRLENDKDCYEALLENKDVIRRMEGRIELVRVEIVEVRGLPFEPQEGKTDGDAAVAVPASTNACDVGRAGVNGTHQTAVNGQSQERRNGAAGQYEIIRTSSSRQEAYPSESLSSSGQAIRCKALAAILCAAHQ